MSTNEGEANQHAEEPKDERVLLASLIANLKVDVDENKKIQKQLKKASTSLTQELENSKLNHKNCKIELERYKTFQKNQKEKEEAELKCKESLHLLAVNKRQFPYTLTIVTTRVVPVTEDSPAVPEQTTVETAMNMTPKNRAHFESEKEVIHLILTGIREEIYSTVDACQTAQEMWEAIERLQQGESINIKDVKTNLF
ncbi:hypothetical protein Tco_0926776 [Tanacetum coccineum]|uniref:Uncharacterized protein n=1 Tax=Tanacetum coccineum TaxID=301880 RepID=A0ABQ5DBK0_9ASTR